LGDDGSYRWPTVQSQFNELADKHNALVAQWNRMVPKYNAAVAPRGLRRWFQAMLSCPPRNRHRDSNDA
jgi:hypothetical protein